MLKLSTYLQKQKFIDDYQESLPLTNTNTTKSLFKNPHKVISKNTRLFMV
jgi:hypothetical protein